MRSNYKKIGDFIELVDIRNKDLSITNLLGLSVNKMFIPSVANIIGSDMANYKIIRKGQFACSLMQVRRDGKIPVALLKEFDEAIISQAYPVFEIKNTEELHPEYLMMWMSRSEFDRRACFLAVGGVRGSLEWEDFCDMELPIPSIEKQREIVKEYNTIVNRIKLNEQLNQKLEETAQAVYKQWFVGKNVKLGRLDSIAKITMGQSPNGKSYNENSIGVAFFQGRGEFGYRYPTKRLYTTEPSRMAKKGDILMSVRAPVGDLNIATVDCCVGRGLAAIYSNYKTFVFYAIKEQAEQLEIFNGEGTVFGSITKDGLNGLQIHIPPESKIKDFNDKCSILDDKIKIHSAENQKLHEMKELLLSSMASKQSEVVV